MSFSLNNLKRNTDREFVYMMEYLSRLKSKKKNKLSIVVVYDMMMTRVDSRRASSCESVVGV